MSTKTRERHDLGHGSNARTTDGGAHKCAPASPKVCDEERTRLTQIRAYDLWEQAGRPDGDAVRERFWSEAEKEISAVSCK